MTVATVSGNSSQRINMQERIALNSADSGASRQ